MRAIAAGLLVLALAPAGVGVAQERSFSRLVTGNGHFVASYDREAARFDTFLEHPYRFAEPRDDPPDLCFAADESRDLAFDFYFGVRVDGMGSWLAELTPDEAGYEQGTGIIRTVSTVGSAGAVSVHTWSFAPFAVERPVLVRLVRVTNDGVAPVRVASYASFNFHLGDAAGGREPSADAEEVSWDGARSTLYEYSDSSRGTMAYVALSPIERATTSVGAAGAYESLRAGLDLDDVRATSGPTSDVAPGMQAAEAVLAPGEETWMAVATLWALDEDAAPDVDELLSWAASRSPEELLEAERAEWQGWHSVAGDTTPTELHRSSAAILRMGQVREPGAGFGQILASLPPGLGDVNAQWNIAWVRDMAYATVGLARTGHLAEAEAALAFQVNAPQGRHVAEVGRPYRISVTRYFGNGEEESDCNADGPNIEFDGFGLFLWSLGEWARAGGDEATLRTWWPTVRDEVADVLVSLVDDSGVVAADSSIWEVHWNGRQRRFTYTSLAAVAGLCEAADLADGLGDADAATRYRQAATGIREALLSRHVDPDGVLAQSAEDLLAGSGYIDAATVEAINWGVVHPDGRVAQATIQSILDGLTVETGIGLMRNDDGGWYDSQEWVFVDLRAIPALGFASRDARADEIRRWLAAHAAVNDTLFSELHEADTGRYAGSIPMVGFGGGAFLIAETEGIAPRPACGEWLDDPGVPMGEPDAGGACPAPPCDPVDPGSPGSGSGCGCTTPGRRTGDPIGAVLVLGALTLCGRRRR